MDARKELWLIKRQSQLKEQVTKEARNQNIAEGGQYVHVLCILMDELPPEKKEKKKGKQNKHGHRK